MAASLSKFNMHDPIVRTVARNLILERSFLNAMRGDWHAAKLFMESIKEMPGPEKSPNGKALDDAFEDIEPFLSQETAKELRQVLLEPLGYQ